MDQEHSAGACGGGCGRVACTLAVAPETVLGPDRCAAPGCGRAVSPGYTFCRACWRLQKAHERSNAYNRTQGNRPPCSAWALAKLTLETCEAPAWSKDRSLLPKKPPTVAAEEDAA